MKVVVEVTDTFERYDCAVVVYCDYGTEIYRRGDMERHIADIERDKFVVLLAATLAEKSDSDLATAIGRLRSDLYIKRLAKPGEST